MSDVFVTTYQVVGDGRALAAAHWAEHERVQETHLAFMTERGALAYRPGRSGRVRTLFFDKAPGSAYRSTGDKQFRNGKWLEEYHPRGNTKAGRDLWKVFEATERLPNAMDLVTQFGWEADSVYPDSGSKVYFPSLCRVSIPSDITFLRLPRKGGDGWDRPKRLLTAIPEDELMLFFYNHNKLAREDDA